jgi:hypothetical protein
MSRKKGKKSDKDKTSSSVEKIVLITATIQLINEIIELIKSFR